jgi:hypothetical protein
MLHSRHTGKCDQGGESNLLSGCQVNPCGERTLHFFSPGENAVSKATNTRENRDRRRFRAEYTLGKKSDHGDEAEDEGDDEREHDDWLKEATFGWLAENRIRARKPRSSNKMLLGGVIIAVLSCAAQSSAAEPASEFLDALRDRGYYDTALEFLDQLPKNALAPAAIKPIIEYERGKTLVMAAGEERDLARREQMLDQAQTSLNAFLTSSPHHRLAHSTRNYLGNLLMVRGNMKVEDAGNRGNSDLLAEASQVYEEAYRIFSGTRDEVRTRLAEVNSKAYDPRTQREEIEIREQLRSDFLQSQLLAAMVMEGRAETVEKGSDAYRELLEKAEAEYRVIEEKYRKWMAGLFAKLYRGRCLQNLGKHPEALGLFRELLDEPEDSEAFRNLKQLALKQALEVWLESPAEGFAEAVDRGSQWLARLRPGQSRQPEPLAIQYSLARANLKYSEQLRESNPRDRLAAERLRAARELAREVAKYPE